MDREKQSTYLRETEAALDKFLSGAADSEVLKAMRYSALGGGKRVRAMLALAACEMVCGDFAPALPAACAVEMVHAYSLIHDDLPCMDDDDMRRGKPACHIAFGEANALLAGDGLLTHAFRTLCAMDTAEKAAVCISILSSAAGHDGMILGQELDLRAETEGADEAALRRIYANKTGALITAAAQMGAVAGGATEKQLSTLRCYTDNIGLVFQIVDDILDCTANEQELGKPIGSDEKNNKSTFVSLFGMDKAKEIAERCTTEAVDAIKNEFNDRSDFLAALAQNLLVRTN